MKKKLISESRKKILFCISDEREINAAIAYAMAIKKYFDEIDVNAVYIKDIKKYEIFQNNINSFTMSIGEYREIEDNVYASIKEKLLGHFDKVYSVRGDRYEVIEEEMKGYDMLVVVKDEGVLSNLLTKLVRFFYKPITIIHENVLDYDFESVLMLNDGGCMVNKSIFNYFKIFKERNIDVLRVNIEDRNRLSERFGNICNIIDENGDNVVEIIRKYINNYSVIVMGGLNYPIFLERLTGQTGLKIIETATKPIFIG